MPTPQALKHTVVNNRSHRWPGYPDYDTVSAQNRVAFPSLYRIDNSISRISNVYDANRVH